MPRRAVIAMAMFQVVLADSVSTNVNSSDLVEGMQAPKTPSVKDITRSLHLAAAAYCPEKRLKSWSCGQHCSGVSGISVHSWFHVGSAWPQNFNGYVGVDSEKDVFVVSLKGTDSSNIKNWVTNLDTLKTYPFSQYPDAGLHKGFWKAWKGVRTKVLAALKELKAEYGSKPVHMVGHSLGGAMATNGAFDLATNHGFSVGLFTFGSPRTGNKAYAKAVVKKLRYVFRVTHNNDIVVHVPERVLGFHHTPWEIHFFDKTGFAHKLCSASGEDMTCANACGWYLTCTSISDHMNYLDMPAFCGSGTLDEALDGPMNSTVVV